MKNQSVRYVGIADRRNHGQCEADGSGPRTIRGPKRVSPGVRYCRICEHLAKGGSAVDDACTAVFHPVLVPLVRDRHRAVNRRAVGQALPGRYGLRSEGRRDEIRRRR